MSRSQDAPCAIDSSQLYALAPPVPPQSVIDPKLSGMQARCDLDIEMAAMFDHQTILVPFTSPNGGAYPVR